jgi:hypothetical protein
MHNQEKHPVDELFAKRLREVEQMPSPRAWEELQGRLTKKKDSKKGVYWAVAASVALAIGCFVSVYYWNSDVPLAAVSPKTVEPISKEPLIVPRVQAQPAPIAKTDPNEPVRDAQPNEPLPQKPVVENKPVYVARQQPKPIVNPQLGEDMKKTTEEPTERVAVATTLKTQAKPASPEVTVVVVEIAEPVAANPAPAPANEEVTEEAPTATKGGKLWQAIKKAKKAEINLDKDAIFAWVKERNNKN